MSGLNPYAIVTKREALLREEKTKAKKLVELAKKRGTKATPSTLTQTRRKQMLEKSKKLKVEKVKKADPKLKARIDKFNKRAAKKKEIRKKNAAIAGGVIRADYL